MKIKNLIGYVVIKYERGKHSIVVPCPDENHIVNGISGYGYLYFRKKDAEKDATSLTNNWDKAYFYVKKAELKVLN